MGKFISKIKDLSNGWIWVIILSAGSVISGALIIWVTPWLYSIHPFSSSSDNQDLAEQISISVTQYSDTIIVNNDTIVTHHNIKSAQTENSNEPSSSSIEKLGTFGDSAGFWNAVFSALAMFAVILTLRHQSKKDNRDEERAILAQFQEQFLTMMSILADIVSQLKISEDKESFNSANFDLSYWNNSNTPAPEAQNYTSNGKSVEAIGRDCFKYIFEQRSGIRNLKAHITIYREKGGEWNEDLYKSLRSVMDPYFDHYFRTLYRILRFIREEDLGSISEEKREKTREFCADLLRAQLSTYELAILYYNGLFPKFRDKSKDQYEHFCIFDNLDPKFLIIEEEREYYKEVLNQKKNLDSFDETKHYKFTAFVSVPKNKEKEDNTKNKSIRILDRLKNFLRKLFCCKTTNRDYLESSYNIDEKERKVYKVLSDIFGEAISLNKLSTMCNLKEKELKIVLKCLEDGGFIKAKLTPNGKKYTILKQLPEND